MSTDSAKQLALSNTFGKLMSRARLLLGSQVMAGNLSNKFSRVFDTKLVEIIGYFYRC